MNKNMSKNWRIILLSVIALLAFSYVIAGEFNVGDDTEAPKIYFDDFFSTTQIVDDFNMLPQDPISNRDKVAIYATIKDNNKIEKVTITKNGATIKTCDKNNNNANVISDSEWICPNINRRDQILFGPYWQGNYNICVKAEDKSGNVGQVCKTLSVKTQENEAPIIVPKILQNNWYDKNNIPSEIKVYKNSDGSIDMQRYITVNDNSVVNKQTLSWEIVNLSTNNVFDSSTCDSVNYPYQVGYTFARCPKWKDRNVHYNSISEGFYKFCGSAQDKSGNKGEKCVQFEVLSDTTPPQVVEVHVFPQEVLEGKFSFEVSSKIKDNVYTRKAYAYLEKDWPYIYSPYFEATGSNYIEENSQALKLDKFSLSLWVLADNNSNPNPSTHAIIANKGGFGSESKGKNMNYGIWLDKADNTFMGGFETEVGENVFVDSGFKADGQWHNVALSYNGGTLSIYVDGKLRNSTSTGSKKPDKNSNDPFRVGANSYQKNRYFKGLVDEVKVWNRALSLQEVQDQYNHNTENTSGRVVYMNMGASSNIQYYEEGSGFRTIDFNASLSDDLPVGTYPVCVKVFDSSDNFTEDCSKAVLNVVAQDTTPPVLDKDGLIFIPQTITVGDDAIIRVKVRDNVQIKMVDLSIDNINNNVRDSGASFYQDYVCDTADKADVYESGAVWECPSAASDVRFGPFPNPGTYELCIEAKDTSDNLLQECSVFNIELQVSGDAQARPGEAATIDFSVTSETGSGVADLYCENVPANVSCTPNPLSCTPDCTGVFSLSSNDAGTFNLTLVAEGSNKVRQDITFISNPAPSLEISKVSGYTYNSPRGDIWYGYVGDAANPLVIDYSASDTEILNCSFEILNIDNLPNCSGQYNASNLSANTYTASLKAQDSLGEEKLEKLFIILQDVNIGDIQCSEDGTNYESCDSVIIRSGKTLWIKAIDVQGSQNIETRSVFPIQKYIWDFGDIQDQIGSSNCSDNICTIQFKEEKINTTKFSVKLTVVDTNNKDANFIDHDTGIRGRSATKSSSNITLLPPLPKIKETSFLDSIIASFEGIFGGVVSFLR